MVVFTYPFNDQLPRADACRQRNVLQAAPPVTMVHAAFSPVRHLHAPGHQPPAGVPRAHRHGRPAPHRPGRARARPHRIRQPLRLGQTSSASSANTSSTTTSISMSKSTRIGRGDDNGARPIWTWIEQGTTRSKCGGRETRRRSTRLAGKMRDKTQPQSHHGRDFLQSHFQ